MKRRILIVEDEPDIRESLQEIFESEGYLITTASNGKEALECLKTALPPNLILLDLMMPTMNGEEFVAEQRLNVDFAKIPVLLMSADNSTEKKAIQMGVNGHVRKPLELEDLLTMVNRYCT